jgi:excisionase family DNA binding protein
MEHTTPGHTTGQVSVAEAARALGVSPETVRRRIKSGEIEARRAIRSQSTVWEVSLPLTTPRGVPPLAPVTDHTVASPLESEHATSATSDVALHPSPRLDATPEASVPLVASIARLIAELAEVRVISDRRADQLVSQAETIGELRAEVAALKAAQATTVAPTAPLSPEPPPGGSHHDPDGASGARGWQPAWSSR